MAGPSISQTPSATGLRVLSGSYPVGPAKRLIRHSHRGHHVGLTDNRPIAALATLDGIDNIHALGHAPHDGVLPIQEMPLLKHDEELTVGAVGVLTARHAHDATVKGNVGKLGRQVRL